jgi:hypothetical protein
MPRSLDNLKGSISGSSPGLGEGMQKIRQLEQKCDELKEESIAYSIAELQRRCENLDAHHGTHTAMLESLQESAADLSSKLQQQRMNGEQQRVELHTQIGGNGTKIETLQSAMAQIQAQLQQQQLDDAEQRGGQGVKLDSLQGALLQLEKKFQSRLLEDAEQRGQLDAQNSGLGVKIESLQNSLAGLQAKMQQQLDVAEQHRAQLQQRLDGAQRSESDVHNATKMEMGSLIAKVESLESSVSLQQRNLMELKEKQELEVTKPCGTVQLDSDRLVSVQKIEALQIGLSSLESKFKQLDEAHHINSELQAQCTDHGAKIDAVESAMTAVKGKIKKLPTWSDQDVESLRVSVDALNAAEGLLTSRISDIAGVCTDQQKEIASLKENIQAEVEVSKAHTQVMHSKLEERLTNHWESAIGAHKLEYKKEFKGMEDILLESSAQAMRTLVAETDAAASEQYLRNFNEERRCRAEQVTEINKRINAQSESLRALIEASVREASMGSDPDDNRDLEISSLQAKTAQQEVMLAELRSRLDLQFDFLKSHFEENDRRTPSDAVASPVSNSELVSLRTELRTSVEALQAKVGEQQAALLELTAFVNKQLKAQHAQLRSEPSRSTSSVAADDRMELKALRTEFQALSEAGQAQHNSLNTQLQQSIEAAHTFEIRLQELQVAVVEVADARRIAKDTDEVTRHNSGSPQSEQHNLLDVVRQLENRVGLQRQEATTLDGLVRSELEVQRRQQGVINSTLQTLQERVGDLENRSDMVISKAFQERMDRVELRSEAMHRQIEDSVREILPGGGSAKLPMGGATAQVPMKIALQELEEALGKATMSGNQEEIQKRIQAVKAKMSYVSNTDPTSSPINQKSAMLPAAQTPALQAQKAQNMSFVSNVETSPSGNFQIQTILPNQGAPVRGRNQASVTLTGEQVRYTGASKERMSAAHGYGMVERHASVDRVANSVGPLDSSGTPANSQVANGGSLRTPFHMSRMRQNSVNVRHASPPRVTSVAAVRAASPVVPETRQS